MNAATLLLVSFVTCFLRHVLAFAPVISRRWTPSTRRDATSTPNNGNIEDLKQQLRTAQGAMDKMKQDYKKGLKHQRADLKRQFILVQAKSTPNYDNIEDLKQQLRTAQGAMDKMKQVHKKEIEGLKQQLKIAQGALDKSTQRNRGRGLGLPLSPRLR